MVHDIRWHQRFSNYRKALKKLSSAIDLVRANIVKNDDEKVADSDEVADNIADVLKEGLIQRFEYTYELAWNVMKDYAEFQGNMTGGGSRDAIREAFQLELIDNAEVWMDMIKSRQLTVHTYNSETANEIFEKIVSNYHPLLLKLEVKMETLRSGKQSDLFGN